MKRNFGALTLLLVILMAAITGCERAPQQIISTMPTSDEESAVQLALDETYDYNRNGAHLIMSYDAATNSFIGTVKNTTSTTLTQVRVEVHLFPSGIELGPTTPVDLAPGDKITITLMAGVLAADTRWTAHPEVGPSSGDGGEGTTEDGGEHGQDGHN